jgi:hypothetical protein
MAKYLDLIYQNFSEAVPLSSASDMLRKQRLLVLIISQVSLFISRRRMRECTYNLGVLTVIFQLTWVPWCSGKCPVSLPFNDIN